jgi:hypothetical protein
MEVYLNLRRCDFSISDIMKSQVKIKIQPRETVLVIYFKRDNYRRLDGQKYISLKFYWIS